jgi:hypothetical protein
LGLVAVSCMGLPSRGRLCWLRVHMVGLSGGGRGTRGCVQQGSAGLHSSTRCARNDGGRQEGVTTPPCVNIKQQAGHIAGRGTTVRCHMHAHTSTVIAEYRHSICLVVPPVVRAWPGPPCTCWACVPACCIVARHAPRGLGDEPVSCRTAVTQVYAAL